MWWEWKGEGKGRRRWRTQKRGRERARERTVHIPHRGSSTGKKITKTGAESMNIKWA